MLNGNLMATIPMTSIILDDEQDSIKLLLDLLKNHPEIKVLDTYTKPDDGIQGILNYRPDIVFLDIQMPEKDGFEVLEQIREHQLNPTVIFITGYDKFAIRAIKEAAFDYILKPVDPEEFSTTLHKLKTTQKGDLSQQVGKLLDHLQGNTRLKFNTRSGFILIDSSEIVYCLADRNYSEIYLADGKKEVLSMNLKKLLHLLPKEQFYRISRSVILNSFYVFKIDRTSRTIIVKFQSEYKRIKVAKKSFQDLDSLFTKLNNR